MLAVFFLCEHIKVLAFAQSTTVSNRSLKELLAWLLMLFLQSDPSLLH